MGRKRGSAVQDFRDAMARLKAGRPNHPDLKERAKLGPVPVNKRTVALESGRSRTLLSYDPKRDNDGDDPYRDIRDELEGWEVKGLSEVERLKAEIREKDQIISNQQMEMLNEVRAKEYAEREADHWRKSYRNLAKSNNVIRLERFVEKKK